MNAVAPLKAPDTQIAERRDAWAEIEGLLDIRESPLPHRQTALDWRRGRNERPTFGGVYVLWWRQPAPEFLASLQNRYLHYLGPGNAPLAWEITHECLHVAPNGLLPLYVGKNASDIADRIGEHLKLQTLRTVDAAATAAFSPRLTTSCQVRDRLDRLFPELADTRPLALNNLAFSCIRVDGPNSFVKRFFLEDLAIGLLRPLFNVDSER